jgi:prepilin-type processing-associated H-X9-DG protein
MQARSTVFQVHLCPSDRSHVLNETNLPYYVRARGNYRGCAGSGDMYGNNPNGAPTGYVPGIGVFSVTRGQIYGTGTAPKQSSFADMIDGSSNTVMFAEALKATINNWSTIGDITLGNMGGSMFSTFLTPNSTGADRVWGPCPLPQGDTVYRWPCTTLGGPNRPPGNHNNNQRTAHAAARSLHPGGVNVALGDGSVRFVSQTVDVNTWRALGTVQGGETLPNF